MPRTSKQERVDRQEIIAWAPKFPKGYSSGTLQKPGGFSIDVQCRFIIEYLKDFSEHRAVKRLGLPGCEDPYIARIVGAKLISTAFVRNEILASQEAVRRKYTELREKVIEELRRLAFSSIANYHDVSGPLPVPDFSDTTADEYAAVSELTVEQYVKGRGDSAEVGVRVKTKLHPKGEALDKLGRHLGLWGPMADEGDTGVIRIVGGLPELDPAEELNPEDQESVE